MDTPSTSTPTIKASPDDYTYDMRVDASLAQILAAVTDDAAIRGWWTAATRSERDGDEVKLFMSNDLHLVDFTIEHSAGTGEVAWAVTACIEPDWTGTKPTFTVRANDDATFTVTFRHIGLRPALPCYDQCLAGWGHFMPSLRQYLETGQGRPNEPRDPSPS